MLQQTTVSTVRGRYEAFLERFPNLRALARAREASVLAAWSGLGYYARARHLHAAARRILERHAGRIPREPEALAALPGFGDYMAAAVPCLAFGARLPAVDANVGRVVSRLDAVEGTAGTRSHTEAIRRRVRELLPRAQAGDLTAALMDLGQQICRPRRPDCGVCPVERFCRARARGAAERYPSRPARPRPEPVRLAAAVARWRGKTLLRREDRLLLRRLWLFPSAEGSTHAAARTRLALALTPLGLRLSSVEPLAAARHTMVHRNLEIRVYRAVRAPGKAARRPELQARSGQGFRWLASGRLARAPIPTLTRKIAAAAGLPAGRV